MTTVTITDADAGKTIAAKPGDTVMVKLRENPTTGYRWAMSSPADKALAPAGDSYDQHARGVGGGGERVFAFRADDNGVAVLNLKHWRAWEGEASVTTRFTVTVAVS